MQDGGCDDPLSHGPPARFRYRKQAGRRSWLRGGLFLTIISLYSNLVFALVHHRLEGRAMLHMQRRYCSSCLSSQHFLDLGSHLLCERCSKRLERLSGPELAAWLAEHPALIEPPASRGWPSDSETWLNLRRCGPASAVPASPQPSPPPPAPAPQAPQPTPAPSPIIVPNAPPPPRPNARIIRP